MEQADVRLAVPTHFSGEYAPKLGQPLQQVAGHGFDQVGIYDTANVWMGVGTSGMVPRRRAPHMGPVSVEWCKSQPQAGIALLADYRGFGIQTDSIAKKKQSDFMKV
ncbi:MAG TPA: hypothetical protein VG097_05455 [Gemmata sp.]|jgi:hypothetical protein|nr:hypothetical protein [Gemmata sp.]